MSHPGSFPDPVRAAQIAEHAEDAGKLADDAPEVFIADNALASADDALPASNDAPLPSTLAAQAEAAAACPTSVLFVDSPFCSKAEYVGWLDLPHAERHVAWERAAAPKELPATVQSVSEEDFRRQCAACAQHGAILHALGGPTVEAAAAAVARMAYAPMFLPLPSVLESLGGFFGLQRDFPLTRLVARSPSAKLLLLVSEAVLALLRADTEGRLRIVNCGVRCFEKEDAKGCGEGCGYRVCQDAMQLYLPSLTKQRIEARPSAAVRLLQCLTSSAAIPEEELAKHEPALVAALKADCQPGSVVLSCAGDDGLPLHFATLYAPSGALAPRVKGLERQALLAHLEHTAKFVDASPQ